MKINFPFFKKSRVKTPLTTSERVDGGWLFHSYDPFTKQTKASFRPDFTEEELLCGKAQR